MAKRCKERRRPAAPAQASDEDALYLGALNELQLAILKLMMVRFRDFLARFGREPTEEEPLFFEVASNRPLQASPAEVREQIIEAAQLTGADSRLLLRFFGLDDCASILH